MAVSVPRSLVADSYQLTLSADVTGYTLDEVEGYDLLVVEGADLMTDPDWPALPYVMQTVFLPAGSVVGGLSLQSEHAVALGAQSLPTLAAVTTYDESSGMLPFEGTSVYPSPSRWNYRVVEFPEYTAVEVFIYLASYDGTTGMLTLFDSTDLLLSYETGASAVIRSLHTDAPSYGPGQTVWTMAEVQNVTGQARDYTARLTIRDANEAIAIEADVPGFTVAAGETYPLNVAVDGLATAGPYQVGLTLFEAGAPLVSGQDSFTLIDGEVIDFAAPATVRQDEYSDVALTFRNYRGETVDVTVEVLILDQGVEVGKLLQRTLALPPNGDGTVTWTWNPAAFAPGKYTLRPVVTRGDVSYFAPQRDIVVRAPFDGLCYTLTLHHNGQGALPTADPARSAECPSDGQYAAEEIVTLTAAPAAGWRVAGWSGTDDDNSTDVMNTLTMPAADHDVTVTYEAVCYSLSLTHVGEGGNPSATPPQSSGCAAGHYVAGHTITLTAAPAGGWRVAGWSGTADDGSVAATNTLTMPAADYTVSVRYEKVTFRLYVPVVRR
jgi:hypothetical protein